MGPVPSKKDTWADYRIEEEKSFLSWIVWNIAMFSVIFAEILATFKIFK